MNRRARQKGQALIEYAFLMVLLATVTVAVIALAGNQLASTYSDISFEITHITDGNTYDPNGVAVSPGNTPTGTCPTGQSWQLRGHKWKCKEG